MKAQRQAMILRLLKEHTVTNQRDLVRLLAGEGIKVSQTTISRDVRELAVTKGRDGDGNVRYDVPERLIGAGESDSGLRRMAPLVLISAEASQNLVVVRTSPGNAQGLAAALDAAHLDGVAGTVAGDDTILIVCSAGTDSVEIAGRLREYAGDRR